MLFVELVVVVIAIVCTEQLKVRLTDKNHARLPEQSCYRLVFIQLTSILPCLVIVQEPADPHPVQSVNIFHFNIEVTHHETGEVKAGHLIEQLVLVDGIRLVGHHEDKAVVALRCEYPCSDRVAVLQYLRPSGPHITHIELPSMQSSARIDTIDDHTRQGTHIALRVIFYHRLHILHAAFAVTIVQLRQSTDKDELIPMVSNGEPLGREDGICFHLRQSSRLEGRIGSGIE